MNRYDLFQPKLSKLPVPSAFPEYFDFENMRFPIAEKASNIEAVWMGESIFRAGLKGIDDLVNGIKKLGVCQDQLAKLESSRTINL